MSIPNASDNAKIAIKLLAMVESIDVCFDEFLFLHRQECSDDPDFSLLLLSIRWKQTSGFALLYSKD